MNKLKYLSLIFIAFIFIFLNGCSKKNITIEFNNDLNVYDQNNLNYDNLIIESKKDYKQYDDHVLELDFNVKLINNQNNNLNLKINNSKAYGNDSLLVEEVLNEYDHNDLTKTIKFSDIDFTLESKKDYEFIFKLVIQDGNPLCKYQLEFNINNVKLNIYSYKEDYKIDNFIYVHNPDYSDAVLYDAEYDINAYFGYKPSSTGSLKAYTIYDWTDEKAVLSYKEERIKYINENDKRIKDLENELKLQNKSIEEIAKACSNLRNQIRLEQYKDDPEGLERTKARNKEKYGHEEGPLAEELYVKYNSSWEMVLEKCYSTNRGMDACCGVYDMYFNLYTELAY